MWKIEIVKANEAPIFGATSGKYQGIWDKLNQQTDDDWTKISEFADDIELDRAQSGVRNGQYLQQVKKMGKKLETHKHTRDGVLELWVRLLPRPEQ
jgi:hypothetical protein